MDTKIYALVSLAAAVLFLGASTVQGEDGCPDSSGGCVQKCGPQGGRCERRWYRWNYRWRCECMPCSGALFIGACIGVDEPITTTISTSTAKPITTTTTTSTAKPITTTTTTSTAKPITTTTMTSTAKPITITTTTSTAEPITTTTTTSTAKPSTTSATTTTTAAPALTLPEPNLVCGSSSRTTTRRPIPDPYSCKHYFLCSGRKKERRSCGYNLQFNPRTLKCSPTLEVGCKLQYGFDLDGAPNCRGGRRSLLPDQETCTSFMVCYRGSRAKGKGCKDGQQFNPVTSRCEHEKNVQCRTKYN